MRKEHYQRYYTSADEVPYDPDRYVVTRDDLEGEEIGIYNRILPRLDHPTPDQLRMLATYSWLAVKLKEAAEDKKLALYIRKCMIFARNRLGLWKPEPIYPMELLLDDGIGFEHTYYCLYLDDAWQVGEK